jgi:hypothetical protein
MIRLEYGLNDATGLPHLQAPAGALNADEHRALTEELERHYARLVMLDGQVCAFRTRTRLAPAGHFLVRVLRDTARLPTLVLVPQPERSAARTRSRHTWLEALVGELHDLVSAAWLAEGDAGDEEARAFERAVEGLAALARNHPDRLAQVLLCGFLTVASQRNPHRARVSRLARKRLERLLTRGRRQRQQAVTASSGGPDGATGETEP